MGLVLYCLVFFELLQATFAREVITNANLHVGANGETIIALSPSVASSFKCKHDDKEYSEGETWDSGHLRYQCGKFGSYTILGCRTNQDHILKIGETYINDYIAHQCFRKDSTTYYKEEVCDLVGQPSCESFRKNPPQVHHTPEEQTGLYDAKNKIITVNSLPEGWKIVDSHGNPVQVISGGINSHTRRTRRQSSRGVGTAIQMPLIIEDEQKKRIAGIGTGSLSLDSRRPNRLIGVQPLKPGTKGGIRSDVQWSGKVITPSGGKKIAAGSGTFTFGTSPTGTLVKKID